MGVRNLFYATIKRFFGKKVSGLAPPDWQKHWPLQDAIRPKEVAELNKLLEKELESLLQACAKFKPERLIGSSGSFDTFANIILRKSNLKLGRKTHYVFKLSEYRTLHRELLSSTYKERLRIPGMLKMRADMILLASLLLTFVLRKAIINEIHLSTHALKEGILADLK